MLYVSRCVGRTNYAIVDTEDGVEQTITRSELNTYVLKYGLEIKGCEVIDYGNGSSYVLTTPYSPDGDIRRTKTSVLKGINYSVSDGVLISMDVRKCRMPTTIRLSEICSSVADFAFDVNQGNWGVNTVILMLDDKVDLKSDKALTGIGHNSAVVINIREVTRRDTVNCVYGRFIAPPVVGSTFDIPVVDIEPRRSQYMAIRLMHYSPYSMSNTLQASEIENALTQEQHILHLYKNKLLKLRYEGLGLRANKRGVDAADVWRMKIAMISSQYDWTEDNIRSKCIEDENLFRLLSETLSECTSYSSAMILRLINYIKYWGNDEDLRNVWMDICAGMVAYKE